ncbi:MAG: aconitase X catalytic domain-containing protein [Clostridiales Family XIII bacterium]|jgi:predicted aconitase|nr:aconitase X catalytic domain-containing protein [Clostridiales Family XIII bacterium]
MILSKEEQALLNGEQGEAPRMAMEILSKIGEINEAERLIPIHSVHLVLHAYKSAFDAGVEAAEKIAYMGGKFSVPTTIDPYGMDAEDWRGAKTPEAYAVMQKRLEDAVMRMGVIPVWTCTPYYGFNMPKYGENVAWSESSAVAFANTVLGARTNRQTAIVDICCGILGKTPETGMHIQSNRCGEVRIRLEVDRDLKSWEYPALGYWLGKKLGSRIGVVEGMRGSPSPDHLKSLCAAAAASGSVTLLHIVGVTPEARTAEEAFGGRAPLDACVVNEADLLRTRQSMCTTSGGRAEFVALGCPHYSVHEIRRVHELLNGRKVHPQTAFWIYANRDAIRLIEKMGIRQSLEASGVVLRAETCMIISPVAPWGFKSMITDSGKCAYYGPAECGTDIIFADAAECVEAAVSGLAPM